MLTIVTPATTSDLTTLAALKAELQITGSASDADLADLIRQASDAITRHCCRTTFGRETLIQREYLTRRREVITLDRDINPTVSAVTVNGEALAAEDWALDGSLLYRLGGGWPTPWPVSMVEISYSAGYVLMADAPYDLERACLLTAAAWRSARGRDPMVRSESTEGVGSTSWIATAEMGALPPQAEALLGPYRLWSVG